MKNKKLCILALAAALFLLTACGAQNQPAALSKTCLELADQVAAAADFQELTDVNEKYLEKYFQISAADLDDWALRRDATRATPEMVLIVKVKAGADQAAVKKAIQTYNDEQLTLYRDYQPDQMSKLEKAKALENGPYIALIVSPDADKCKAALGEGWR